MHILIHKCRYTYTSETLGSITYPYQHTCVHISVMEIPGGKRSLVIKIIAGQ